MSCSAEPRVYQDESSLGARCSTVSGACPCRKADFFRFCKRVGKPGAVSQPRSDLSAGDVAGALTVLLTAAPFSVAALDGAGVEVPLNVFDQTLIDDEGDALFVSNAGGVATLRLVQTADPEIALLQTKADSAVTAAAVLADGSNSTLSVSHIAESFDAASNPQANGPVAVGTHLVA